jgi:hypothetical protein
VVVEVAAAACHDRVRPVRRHHPQRALTRRLAALRLRPAPVLLLAALLP